jgi:hypothetical protein
MKRSHAVFGTKTGQNVPDYLHNPNVKALVPQVQAAFVYWWQIGQAMRLAAEQLREVAQGMRRTGL